MDFWADSAYLYRQSYIPAHSELAWILDCFAYFGEVSRMTQFKDKSSQAAEAASVSVGLFNYPVLMAADILLYEAQYVPVGDDQRQHLELTRNLALRMNHAFEADFPKGIFTAIPVEWDKQKAFAGTEAGGRVRSLRNPLKKMSKSVTDPAGTIDLLDDPKDAAHKVMGATTDSIGSIDYDWATQPGIANLLEILALLSDQPIHKVAAQWHGKSQYGELKQAVAARVDAFLADFQAKLQAVDQSKLLQKLEDDEAKVRAIAEATLLRVQQAVGLRPRR